MTKPHGDFGDMSRYYLQAEGANVYLICRDCNRELDFWPEDTEINVAALNKVAALHEAGMEEGMARRIDNKEDLCDGENWSYCVLCWHLVAVGLEDPSWGSSVPPKCNFCLAQVAELVKLGWSEPDAEHMIAAVRAKAREAFGQ